MDFPEPVIEIAIEPKSKADQEKLGVALQKLAAEDPTFRVSTDQESGQTILKGMGELHLDIKVDILQAHLQGRSQHRPAAGRLSRDARPQDRDQLHPQEADRRFGPVRRGEDHLRTGRAGRRLFVREQGRRRLGAAGIRAGRREGPGCQAKENGLLAGFPVIDFKATLVDGKYHDVDSSVLAFEIAARAAFRELRDKAQPKLLEPIMKVEVTTPEDYVGDVIGDLNSRRGMIQGTDQRGNAQVIIAMVPLANMFGYVNTLRSMSQGRANFHMEYDHYEAVPQAVADEVVKKYA